MTTYQSTEQLYSCMQILFERMRDTSQASLKPLTKSKMIIRFVCENPAGEIWVDGRHNPVQTSFGSQNLEPTLEIDCTADMLHAIMLGTESLSDAYKTKRIRLKGPLIKALKLAGLFSRSRELYPVVLKEQGMLS